nr:hypothetical protein [uncultured Flavobacterium sp.]
MKDFLKNYLTIVSEFIILILASIWYYNSREIEPLIAIIISSVALLSSLISFFSQTKENQTVNIIGKSNEKFLHEDFLYNYIPGEITINKIIEDLGQPLVKIKDYVEQEWNSKKKFKFFVYKYKFTNAVVLFTTELKDDNIISISLISKLNKKHPIKCRYSYAETDKFFGEAIITENIIENSESFNSQSYASWIYTEITSRYADFRPIKYLYFTYFIYNHYENKTQMRNQEIDGICISTMSDVNPIIHFDDYRFN